MLHRSVLVAAGAAALLAGLFTTHTTRSIAMPAPTLSFAPHEIAKFPDGYQVAVADMDGDGRPDVLALSTRPARVVWYGNPQAGHEAGPGSTGWEEHPIVTTLPAPISVSPEPAPHGEVRRIAVATDFALNNSMSGGRVWILERPREAGREWSAVEIDAIPTSHRLKWADLDGDGRFELVNAPLLGRGARAPDYAEGAAFVFYREANGKWQRATIAEGLRLFHGMAVVQASPGLRPGPAERDRAGMARAAVSGERRDSLLSASAEGVHLFRPSGKAPDITWTKTRMGEGASSEVCMGRLGARDFLATIEPWHGNQVVVYTPEERGPWKHHVIDSSFSDGHALACGDLDGDGSDEIVAGYRGKGASLFAYKARDASGEQWQRVAVDEGGMAASGCVLADINGDGRLDIVAIGASTGNVKWYEPRW